MRRRPGRASVAGMGGPPQVTVPTTTLSIPGPSHDPENCQDRGASGRPRPGFVGPGRDEVFSPLSQEGKRAAPTAASA